MVQGREFREDLFYRLNVIPINLPPLRERYEDVKLLIEHYLGRFMKEHRKNMYISKAAMELLLDYPWPGNIRELQNTMERIVLICPNGEILSEMLAHVLPLNYQRLYMQPELAKISSNGLITQKDLQKIEQQSIIQALKESNGIQAKAARALGITVRQIIYKIKQYKIES